MRNYYIRWVIIRAIIAKNTILYEFNHTEYGDALLRTLRISEAAFKKVTKAKGRLTDMNDKNYGYSEAVDEVFDDWLKRNPNGR